MDKSPEKILDSHLIHILNEFKQKVPSIVLCSESFHRIEFLNRMIDSVKKPIIFVDMDLLFSGYVESKMIQKKENVTIFQPNKENWTQTLFDITSIASKEKFLVILDSINGVYNLFDNHLDSARFINSCIMLMSSILRQTDSLFVITAIAKRKENKEWGLLPGGKQIIKSDKTGTFLLKKIDDDLSLTVLEERNANPRIFEMKL